MRTTLYDEYQGPPLTHAQQLRRLRRAMDGELTPVQREILIAYYFQQKKLPQIARERGISTSSASRTLRRAEKRLRHALRY